MFHITDQPRHVDNRTSTAPDTHHTLRNNNKSRLTHRLVDESLIQNR
jgi:hypothetical protein